MASPASPAVCSTTSYQHFHPLAGFPPAQGWCSTVSLLPDRNARAGAKGLAPRDGPCPLGSTLCDLLAELKALDRESAREAWYGILLKKHAPFFKIREDRSHGLAAVALECVLGMHPL